MNEPRSGGPFRAPIVAAVLLGSAVALVWFGRNEPVDVATESGSPPAILVEPPGVDIAAQPGDESRAGFPPNMGANTAASVSMPRGTPFHKVLDNVGLEPRWTVAVRDLYGTLRSIAYVWREGFAPARPARDGESPDEN